MKKLLVVCGAGHATSTVAVSKINRWIEESGQNGRIEVVQSKIIEELNNIAEDHYDAVVSTTIVPNSIKAKVISGLPLLTGVGIENVFQQIMAKFEE